MNRPILLTMSEPKDHHKPDARTALLNAAKKVFASKGYDGTTVKDLADEAGLNVSLVSYHFGGKEGLYRSCLTGFAEARIESMERLLKTPETSEEFKLRLRLFAEEMTDVHIKDPDICTIVHRDIEYSSPIAAEIFKGVFFRLFLVLVGFLKSAEAKGLIHIDHDPELLTSIVFGSLMDGLKSDRKRALLGKGSIRDQTFRDQFLDCWVDFAWSGLVKAKRTSIAEHSSERGQK